jgi:phage-related minor tail protein
MADRIKGITIEIGGDTTKLSDALKGANAEIKECQSALRDVNKLLKLDPGNVDLLKQKQGYLKTEIDATKKKLDEEKTALAQLKASSTTGDVTEEQKALEREIAETESSLSSLKKEYKDFGSVSKQVLQNAGNNIKNVGGKITGVGKSMTAGLTGPIVGLGAAAVAAFGEVDAGLDIVATKTGASGEALSEME